MMFIRALVLFLTAQFAEALTQLIALLRMDPDNRRATMLRSRIKNVQKYYNDATTLYLAGRWDDSVNRWTDALQVLQFSTNILCMLIHPMQLVAEHEEEGCGGLVRARILYHRATAMAKVCSKQVD